MPESYAPSLLTSNSGFRFRWLPRPTKRISVFKLLCVRPVTGRSEYTLSPRLSAGAKPSPTLAPGPSILGEGDTPRLRPNKILSVCVCVVCMWKYILVCVVSCVCLLASCVMTCVRGVSCAFVRMQGWSSAPSLPMAHALLRLNHSPTPSLRPTPSPPPPPPAGFARACGAEAGGR